MLFALNVLFFLSLSLLLVFSCSFIFLSVLDWIVINSKSSSKQCGEQTCCGLKEMNRDVLQVWFCHLFQFATVKSSIHNRIATNYEHSILLLIALLIHSTHSIAANAFFLYFFSSADVALLPLHTFGHSFMLVFLFFSHHFQWCWLIISIEFEISGKIKTKEYPFSLSISAKIHGERETFHICIYLWCVSMCLHVSVCIQWECSWTESCVWLVSMSARCTQHLNAWNNTQRAHTHTRHSDRSLTRAP